MPDAMITVEDGPYIVNGDVWLRDDAGRDPDLPQDVELRPLGRSYNQPFCDGTHPAIDFDGALAN